MANEKPWEDFQPKDDEPDAQASMKPWEDFQPKKNAEPQHPAYTLGEHAANMAVAGYLPQAVAITAKGVAPFYDAITGSHVAANLPSYTELRDETAEQLAQGKKQNPAAGWTGDIGGGILGAMGTGIAGKALGVMSKAPKAATVAQKALANAKGAAIMGAIANPGETPGEISPIQPVARTANATVAALGAAALTPVWEGVKLGGSRLLGMVTNTPKKAVQIMGERAPEVAKVIDDSGGELPVAADEMKEKVLKSISDTKKTQGDLITKELANNSNIVPVNTIIDQLEASKAKLNPHYNPSDIAQINEIIQAIKNTAGEDGAVSMKELFDTKKFLQSRAQGSYVNNGQLFSTGAEAQKAASGAASVARKILHKNSPSISSADAVFESLHDLDDKMSASLLGTGKAENVFASAGGGKGNINQVMLRKVGELTGTDPLSDAQLIYAAKYFKDPSIRQGLLRMGLNIGNYGASLSPPGMSGYLLDQQTNPVERRLKLINRTLGSDKKQ